MAKDAMDDVSFKTLLARINQVQLNLIAQIKNTFIFMLLYTTLQQSLCMTQALVSVYVGEILSNRDRLSMQRQKQAPVV